MTTLAEKHPHPRDQRIERIQNSWFIDGNLCKEWGATRALEPYFPNTFDADKVYGKDVERRRAAEISNLRAMNFGKFISKCAEDYYNGEPFSPDPLFPEYTSLDFPEWHILLKLMATLPSSWVVWRVEWPLFSTKIKTIAIPDMVLRDMAFPNEYRFIILDFKCQVKPTDIPFCSARSRDESERTKCNLSKFNDPHSHDQRCPAVAKGCLKDMFATKVAKCGAQMALYRKILIERYIFKLPVIIDRMVGVYVKQGFEGVEHFYQQDIDRYDPMVEEIIQTRKK